MKKYLLTVGTFLIHTLTSNPKAYENKTLNEISNGVSDIQTKENKTFIDTNLVYTKKGSIHTATWYNMHGSKTASGERFHKDSLTAAYNFSKLGSLLRVTNLNTKETVIVKVNDRMGYRGKNHIDLSKCAFDSIANPNSGRIKVLIEEISHK